MLSPRHLARMPSNLPDPEVRWKRFGTASGVAGTPISARYHSNGGVPPGDWSRRVTLLLLLQVGWHSASQTWKEGGT